MRIVLAMLDVPGLLFVATIALLLFGYRLVTMPCPLCRGVARTSTGYLCPICRGKGRLF